MPKIVAHTLKQRYVSIMLYLQPTMFDDDVADKLLMVAATYNVYFISTWVFSKTDSQEVMPIV